MAFTEAESKKCNVIRIEKVFRDSTFENWVFIVVDSYGEFYEWTEESSFLNYSSEPTDTQILEYVKDYLTGGNHGSGGGNYSAVAPTQTGVAQKPRHAINKNNCINKIPANEPEPPGSPN